MVRATESPLRPAVTVAAPGLFNRNFFLVLHHPTDTCNGQIRLRDEMQKLRICQRASRSFKIDEIKRTSASPAICDRAL